MLNPKTRLTVLHDNNSSFSDYSDEALDFVRDDFTIDMVSAQDKLYIGFEKPVNAVYVRLKTANTQANTLTVKYWNGSAWTALAGFHDDTQGFTRNGFIQWSRNQTSEDETTVNSTEQYWYQVSASADWDAGTEVWGINLIFADDNDLLEEQPAVTDSTFFVNSDTDHIRAHIAARNEIIQRLRNKDNKTVANDGNAWENLTQWDLLEIDEVREAAKYLALSKIFFNISDSADDSYAQKSALYESWGTEKLRLARLSIDTDDDGLSDATERLALLNVRRVTR